MNLFVNYKEIIEYFLMNVNTQARIFSNRNNLKRRILNNLYEIIKKLCESNSISVFSLERKLGFGNGTISKWDNSSPTVANLKKVADYFGVTIEELLGEKEAV